MEFISSKKIQCLSFLIISFFLPGAHAGPIIKKEVANSHCVVPGEPELWKLAYCLLKEKTQSKGNKKVKKCLNQIPEEVASARGVCLVNVSWKKKYCEIVQERKFDKRKSYQRICNGEDIPKVVEKGQ